MDASKSQHIEQNLGSAATWLFQANPNRYRIEASLVREREELWNLNQHGKDVKAGDRVLIWLSGDDAGIYAVGTVVADPVDIPDSPTGQTYWIDPRDGRKVKPRVRVRYDRLLLQRPLLKAFLMTDPVLQNLRVIRSPRGTNYRVTHDEWNSIQVWLDS